MGNKYLISALTYESKLGTETSFVCCGKDISEALAYDAYLSQGAADNSTCDKGKPAKGSTDCYSTIAGLLEWFNPSIRFSTFVDIGLYLLG